MANALRKHISYDEIGLSFVRSFNYFTIGITFESSLSLYGTSEVKISTMGLHAGCGLMMIAVSPSKKKIAFTDNTFTHR